MILNKKITDFPAAASLLSTDLLAVVVNPATVPVTKKAPISVLLTLLDTQYLLLSGSLASVSDHSHTVLTEIGTNTHAQLDTFKDITVPATYATMAGTLAQFGATTSLQLASVISNETGTGALVFGTTPTFTTSALFPTGTAAAPAIAHVGDTDTGMYFGTNAIGFTNAGVLTLLLGAEGNVAIGSGTTAGRVLGVFGYQPANVATTPGTAADDLLIMSGGIGGTTTIATTGVGGIGAAFTFTGGVGGVASSAATSSTGGKGGEITLVGGLGGAAATIGTTRVGGAGGALTGKAGAGGVATGGTTGTAGAGGKVTLSAGTGGAGTTSTNSTGGAGGNFNIYAGRGGAGADVNGAGGAFQILCSLANEAQVSKVYVNSTGMGIGGTGAPAYSLEVQTDSAGKPGVGGLWTVVSDKRLKENVQFADLDRCYEIVKIVPLKHYAWTKEAYSDERIKDRNVIGWIADDVKAVFPKAVNTTRFRKADGNILTDALDLDGGEMNMATYGAVQKLQKMIEELQKRIN